jgi:hypothetical protein
MTVTNSIHWKPLKRRVWQRFRPRTNFSGSGASPGESRVGSAHRKHSRQIGIDFWSNSTRGECGAIYSLLS